MPRRKKKPFYAPDEYRDELLKSLTEDYGTFDDRTDFGDHFPSLNALAEEYDINPLKARKLLITAGVYSTATSRRIAEYAAQGKKPEEIMELTNLSMASVNSYLPYKDVIYKMPERSVDADRSRVYRQRTKYVGELKKQIDHTADAHADEMKLLWKCVEVFEGYRFENDQGKTFSYRIKQDDDGEVGELLFGIKRYGGLPRATVEQAYEHVMSARQEQGTDFPVMTSPERLDVSGASYLYPIFVRFGVVEAG